MQPSAVRDLIVLPVKFLGSLGRNSRICIKYIEIFTTCKTDMYIRERERIRERVRTCGRQREKLGFCIKKTTHKTLRYTVCINKFLGLLNTNGN